MISIFKDCLKSEETVFRFDLLTLNERCVELLRNVQKLCVELSPLDYPLAEYGHDRDVNSCFLHLLAGVAGMKREQPLRFNEVCLIVKETVKKFGAEEYKNATSRCFIKGDGSMKVTDAFYTPFEDNIPISERIKYSRIVVDDPDRGIVVI